MPLQSQCMLQILRISWLAQDQYLNSYLEKRVRTAQSRLPWILPHFFVKFPISLPILQLPAQHLVFQQLLQLQQQQQQLLRLQRPVLSSPALSPGHSSLHFYFEVLLFFCVFALCKAMAFQSNGDVSCYFLNRMYMCSVVLHSISVFCVVIQRMFANMRSNLP